MNNISLFSRVSGDYACYRPAWPEQLFRILAGLAPGNALAWDCGTGSGQAATGLAAFFHRVIASDASAEQISRAVPRQNIEYRVADAGNSGIDPDSVDLVLAAQALHWFATAAFFREAGRVLKKGGLLAAVSYQLPRIRPGIDRLIDRFHGELLGDYWPPERVHVDTGYRDIFFPLEELALPPMRMEHDWTRDQFLGYLGTWSAAAAFRADRDRDPIDHLLPELDALWPEDGEARRVRWPLVVRAGRFRQPGS